jgi:hypothetical protein
MNYGHDLSIFFYVSKIGDPGDYCDRILKKKYDRTNCSTNPTLVLKQPGYVWSK